MRRTRFGARLRAAVDNPRAARGLGIDVDRVFTLAFALGSALAGLGGALGVEVLGLDPGFPVKYIVYFLIVVAVGGSGSILGSLVASLVLGVADVTGKYYLPAGGRFRHLCGDGGHADLASPGLAWPCRRALKRSAAAALADSQAGGTLALVRAAVLDAAPGRLLRVSGKLGPAVPDRHHGTLLPVLGPDPWLCRHRFAGSRGVFRRWRLCRRAAGEPRPWRSAAGSGRRRAVRCGAGIRQQLSGTARGRPDAADGDVGRGDDAVRSGQQAHRVHRRGRWPLRHGSAAAFGTICL